jgi:hypothetical protein
MRTADHDLVKKNPASYPVSGMSNDNISLSVAGLWPEVLNLRSHKYKANAHTTQSSLSVK